MATPERFPRPPLRYRRLGGGYRKEDVEFALAELRQTLGQLDNDLETLRKRAGGLEDELRVARAELEQYRAKDADLSQAMANALRRAGEIEEAAHERARAIIASAEEAALRERSDPHRSEPAAADFDELVRLKDSLVRTIRNFAGEFEDAVRRAEHLERPPAAAPPPQPAPAAAAAPPPPVPPPPAPAPAAPPPEPAFQEPPVAAPPPPAPPPLPVQPPAPPVFPAQPPQAAAPPPPPPTVPAEPPFVAAPPPASPVSAPPPELPLLAPPPPAPVSAPPAPVSAPPPPVSAPPPPPVSAPPAATAPPLFQPAAPPPPVYEPPPAPPPPAAPPPPPVPEAAPPPAQPAYDAGEPVFDTHVELDAGPFADFASLSAFERALAHLPRVQDVYVRRLANDRALIELTLSEPSQLLQTMRESLPYELDVRSASRSSVVVNVYVQSTAGTR